MPIDLKSLAGGTPLQITVAGEEGTVYIQHTRGNVSYARKRDELLADWRRQSVDAYETNNGDGSFATLIATKDDSEADGHALAKFKFEQVWKPPQGVKLEIDRQALPGTALVGWDAEHFGAEYSEELAMQLLRNPEAYQQIADGCANIHGHFGDLLQSELLKALEAPLGGASNGAPISKKSTPGGAATSARSKRAPKQRKTSKSPPARKA